MWGKRDRIGADFQATLYVRSKSEGSRAWFIYLSKHYRCSWRTNLGHKWKGKMCIRDSSRDKKEDKRVMNVIADKVLKHKKAVLLCFIISAIVCLFLKQQVVVNYNLADYLPDNEMCIRDRCISCPQECMHPFVDLKSQLVSSFIGSASISARNKKVFPGFGPEIVATIPLSQISVGS